MCQVSTAMSFDYNYKVHLFYIFVNLFKYMGICLWLLRHYQKLLFLNDSWKVSLSSGMLMKN